MLNFVEAESVESVDTWNNLWLENISFNVLIELQVLSTLNNKTAKYWFKFSLKMYKLVFTGELKMFTNLFFFFFWPDKNYNSNWLFFSVNT